MPTAFNNFTLNINRDLLNEFTKPQRRNSLNTCIDLYVAFFLLMYIKLYLNFPPKERKSQYMKKYEKI